MLHLLMSARVRKSAVVAGITSALASLLAGTGCLGGDAASVVRQRESSKCAAKAGARVADSALGFIHAKEDEVHGGHEQLTYQPDRPAPKVAALAGVTGPVVRKVGALRVNFNGEASGCSAADLNTVMFTDPQSLRAFYRENSYGKFDITGGVIGTVTINASSDTCDPNGWAAAADAAARTAGIDLSSYESIFYVPPAGTANACGFFGISNGGGTPGITVMRGDMCTNGADIYYHEFGHHFGIMHASTPASQYGDQTDVMGGFNGFGTFNAPHRLKMGWLPASLAPGINTSGTYKLYNLESVGAENRVLRIAKPGSSQQYYVSFRVPTGFDAYMNPSAQNGVSIHSWSGSGTNTTLLSMLQPGQSWSDSGITIKLVSRDSVSGTVEVTLPAGASMPGAPPAPYFPDGPGGGPTGLPPDPFPSPSPTAPGPGPGPGGGANPSAPGSNGSGC